MPSILEFVAEKRALPRKRPGGRRAESLVERFWARVEKTETCWLWTGVPDKYGYGRFAVAGKTFKAHRIGYEIQIGPIPDGLTLDHRCHTEDETCSGGNTCPHRRCVRGDHLEPVEGGENTRRGLVRRTHCKHGHEFTPENTWLFDRKEYVIRHCRTCRATAWEKENQRRSKLRKAQRVESAGTLSSDVCEEPR